VGGGQTKGRGWRAMGPEHCYQLRLKVIARQTLPAAASIEKAIAARKKIWSYNKKTGREMGEKTPTGIGES